MPSGSPLVWGAWIEMHGTDSVRPPSYRRPSYGGRGLKFYISVTFALGTSVAPRMGGVD